jgi:hypothetical protein
MQYMKETVYHGCESDSGDDDDGESAIKRITAREYLSPRRLWLPKRPHAGKNHRRVFEGIDGRQTLKKVITGHSCGKRDGNETDPYERAEAKTPQKKRPSKYGTGAMFKSE